VNIEEYRKIKDEVNELASKIHEYERHERGGTTLGEILDKISDRDIPEPSPEEAARQEAARRLSLRKEARRKLQYMLGDAEDAMVGHWYYGGHLIGGACSLSWYLDPHRRDHPDSDHDPAQTAAMAASVMGTRALKNRVAKFKEVASLLEQMADGMEERLKEEATIRRIR
jgi:hypothetical protein